MYLPIPSNPLHTIQQVWRERLIHVTPDITTMFIAGDLGYKWLNYLHYGVLDCHLRPKVNRPTGNHRFSGSDMDIFGTDSACRVYYSCRCSSKCPSRNR